MVGMTVTDTWKILKKKYLSHSLITEFADILAHEMLDHAQSLQDDIQETVVTIRPDKPSVTTLTITADICNIHLTHTKCFLKDKKKVRCIWCRRVNLVEQKTTMKCMGCGKGFCQDSSGFGFWSHHVVFIVVLCAPKKGTPKRLVAELESGGDHDGWWCSVFLCLIFCSF